MNSDQIGGVLRAVAAGVIPLAVAKGWIDAGNAAALSSALITFVVAVWSWQTNKPGTVIPSK